MSLAGKTALITGAARRVGRAIARELATAGCDVAIHYNTSVGEAHSLQDEISSLGHRASVIQADLRDPDRWPQLITQTAETHGGLDILINNASVFQPDAVNTPALPDAGQPNAAQALDVSAWDNALRVNLLAPVGLAVAAAPLLRASGGRIVNLLDSLIDRTTPQHMAYLASKAALASATRNLARMLAPDVCVFGVSPGIAEFPENYDDEIRRRLLASVPQARAGSPEEVAKLVRFLVEHGDYMTGSLVSIDGGRGLV